MRNKYEMRWMEENFNSSNDKERVIEMLCKDYERRQSQKLYLKMGGGFFL